MVIELPSLYGHQVDMVDRLRNSIARHRASILQAPPGTGKTRIAKWMLGTAANREPKPNQSGKSLFAVHRRGLVDNASNSFSELPALPHGVLMSGVAHDASQAVQVASIDTLLSWFCEGGNYSWDETFDLIVYDECVTGDAIVETELGPMRLDEIPLRKPLTVRSYSKEKGKHFAKILNWTHKGERNTIEVHTHHGKVQCTPDHEIYTRRGWLQGKDLLDTDEILVSADVGSDYLTLMCSQDTDTQSESRAASGNPRSRMSIASRHNACAVADRKRDLHSRTGKSGASNGHYTRRIMQKDIAGLRAINHLSLLNLSGKRYLERFSEILLSDIRTLDRLRHGSIARTAMSKRNGLSTKRRFSIASALRHEWLPTLAGVNSRYVHPQGAIRRLSKYINLSLIEAKSECLGNGSMALVTSDLHGGFATMVRLALKACSCTQKGFPRKTTNSSLTGSAKTSAKPPCAKIRKRRHTLSALQAGHRSKLGSECPNTSQSACDTNWSRVTKIVSANPTDVYDIEVEGSHCFFANNLLVHNCHSHCSKLKTFLTAHNKRRLELGLSLPYVIGLSATPQAEGLADLYQEIVRGPETQWLIDQGFLKPYRYFRATLGKLGLLVKRGDEYTSDSVSSAMEGLSGDLVRDWKKWAEGRATVGFFPRRAHAQEAQEALCAAGIKAEYVDGDTDDDRRRMLYKWLNSGTIEYLCNVGVVERGTDIPRVGCVQMCTAVGNIVRWCLDEDTQILTPHGWKGISDEFTEVYQVDKNLKCSVSEIIGRTERPVGDVPMFGIAGRSLNIRVSKHHRMLIHPRRRECKVVEAQEMPCEFRIPVACFEDAAGVPLTDAEIRLLGLVATDGTIDKSNNQIKIFQSDRHHECIAYIENVINECGLAYSKSRMKDTSTAPIVERHPRWVYTISSGKPIRSRMDMAGKTGWKHLQQWVSKNPAAKLDNCTRDQLLVLLEAMKVGDGDKYKCPSIDWNPRTFRLAVQNLEYAEALQSLCVRRGVRCVLTDNGCGVNCLLVDTTRQWWSGVTSASDGRDVWQELPKKESEWMWCVEVPAGFLIARRDGKPFIVGNCQMIGRGSRVHPDVPDCIVLDHGGGIAKHGFFEDLIPWTLDWSHRPSKEHVARPRIECPRCQAVYRGGKCKNCGYEPSRGERKSQGLDFDGAELKEVKPRERSHAKEQQSCEQIMISALYAAGRSNKNWKQALAIAYRKAGAQGVQFKVPKRFEVGGRVYAPVPYGNAIEAMRLVKDLYDFV